MAQQLRRFEVLLPLHFNDGQPVPPEVLDATRRELEARFESLSLESQVIRGIDRRTGEQEDRLVRLFVDAPDTQRSRAFFLERKAAWKERFRQEEIWVVTYPVEVL